MKERKLAFYEIGKGSMAHEAQALFEELQEHALRTGTPTKLTIEIAIAPPTDDDQRYGKIQYQLSHKKAPLKSKGYTTLFKHGCIIQDGDSDVDAAQLDLDLPKPLTFKPAKEA